LLIEGKYNIKPCISAELKLVQATNDFIWLRHENSQYHSNVMVNIYPFSDSTYSRSMAVKWRNQSTKKYLKTAEGTWVEVSESGQFPIRFFTANGSDDGSEFMMNGWYTELNTDRRGPFIRRIIKDSVNQRIIAIDGFLFAPNQPRLHLMRELEIMVNLFAVKS
jgi:hypothetical protein